MRLEYFTKFLQNNTRQIPRNGKHTPTVENKAATRDVKPNDLRSFRQWLEIKRRRRSNQTLYHTPTRAKINRINRILFVFAIVFSCAPPLLLRQDGIYLRSLEKLSDIKSPGIPEAALSKKNSNPAADKITLTRNYFTGSAAPANSRRPVPMNAAAAASISQRYVLIGILMGDVPQAILREVLTENSIFLRTGESLGKYRVEKIVKDRIILEFKGEQIELTI